MTFHDASKEFELDCKVRHLSPTTIDNYTKQLRYLENHLSSEFSVLNIEDVKHIRNTDGLSNPLHFLAESSADVCNFESQHKGASLEIQEKCWQPANRYAESVSKMAPQKKKNARFC